MLRLPESGLRPYRNGHRTDLSIFCDWLEGSLLFTGHGRLSLSDIKDVLMEEHLYEKQDKASEFLADAWREFDRRKSALGQSYPIQIENLRLQRMMPWRQSPAYSFCLLLSFAERYRSWAKGFGTGFTLIELSIVLVIIGLIVGGVLVGQSLIRAAKLQSVTTQITKFTTAVYTFELKYNNELPGDMADATNSWGTAVDCSQHAAAGAGTQTCNGDGNSQIQAGTREMYLFWQHLSNAGLIEGTYTGAYGPGASAWSDVIGTNVPATHVDGYSVEFWNDGSYTAWNFWAPLTEKNLFWVNDGGAIVNPMLTTSEAYALDKKYDDGLPGSGHLLTYGGGNLGTWGCATSGDPTTAVYNTTLSGQQCFLMFDEGL